MFLWQHVCPDATHLGAGPVPDAAGQKEPHPLPHRLLGQHGTHQRPPLPPRLLTSFTIRSRTELSASGSIPLKDLR